MLRPREDALNREEELDVTRAIDRAPQNRSHRVFLAPAQPIEQCVVGAHGAVGYPALVVTLRHADLTLVDDHEPSTSPTVVDDVEPRSAGHLAQEWFVTSSVQIVEEIGDWVAHYSVLLDLCVGLTPIERTPGDGDRVRAQRGVQRPTIKT
jgi:hypothetical protein